MRQPMGSQRNKSCPKANRTPRCLPGILRPSVALLLLCALCAHMPPAVSPHPQTPWTPPKQVVENQQSYRAAVKHKLTREIPREYLDRLQTLTLPDIVNIALLTSGQTFQAWAQARAAAAAYESRRSSYLPNISGTLSAGRQKGVLVGGSIAATSSQVYSAGASGNWLVFDWGGRRASVNESREALFAANWVHTAAIQNVILQVEQSFYDYFSAKALYAAQRSAVDESQTTLGAAQDRQHWPRRFSCSE